MQKDIRRKAKRLRHLMTGASFVVVSLGAHPAIAETAPAAAPATQVDDIIVTAQKREQSIQHVPIAVTAIGGEMLAKLNVSSQVSLATLSPNFQFDYRDPALPPSASMRGVSFASGINYINDSSIATYVDEAFVATPLINGNIFDLQRVEVLKGPQGTLFGRNASAGLVHFITANPTDHLSGYANLSYGQNDHLIADGAISGPLGEKVSARIAGRYESSDGDYRNVAIGPIRGDDRYGGYHHNYALRGKLKAELTEALTANLTVGYSDTSAVPLPAQGYGVFKPGTPATGLANPANVCDNKQIFAQQCLSSLEIRGLGTTSRMKNDEVVADRTYAGNPDFNSATNRQWLALGRFDWDFDWATLTSLTSYTSQKFHYVADQGTNATTVPTLYNVALGFDEKNHSVSQEIRLAGRAGDHINWVAGAYYYSDVRNQQARVILSGTLNGLNPLTGEHLVQGTSTELDTRSYAAFGQVEFPIASNVTIVLGGRYTNETRELKSLRSSSVISRVVGGALTDVTLLNQDTFALLGDPYRSTKAKNLTGRVGVNWQATPQNLLYASASRGFKSGGYSISISPITVTAGNPSGGIGPVKQEIVNAFEIGSKNELFGRKLRFNIAAFYYLYQGIQQSVVTFNSAVTPPFSVGFLNAGDAHVYGVDAELYYRPNRYFDAIVNGGLLHTKVTKSDVFLDDTADPTINTAGAASYLLPLKGHQLTRSPKWNVQGIVALHYPTQATGIFTIQSEVVAMGSQYYTLDNSRLGKAPQNTTVNLRLLWESPQKRYNAQLFVTNLFDATIVNQSGPSGISTGDVLITRALPRLWGVKLGMTF